MILGIGAEPDLLHRRAVEHEAMPLRIQLLETAGHESTRLLIVRRRLRPPWRDERFPAPPTSP